MHSISTGERTHARDQTSHARAYHSVAHASLVCGSRQEALCRNTIPQTFSRHKIFFRDRNWPSLGKTLSRHQETLVETQTLHLNPKSGRNTKFLSRHGDFFMTKKASVSTKMTQYAWKSCRDKDIPIATQGHKTLSRALCCRECVPATLACLSLAPRSGCAPSLSTLSQPRARETV